MILESAVAQAPRTGVFERATYICEFQDYLNFRLTGRMVGSVSNVSVRWHYNAAADGPPSACCWPGWGWRHWRTSGRKPSCRWAL